jgi:hypothetical protein
VDRSATRRRRIGAALVVLAAALAMPPHQAVGQGGKGGGAIRASQRDYCAMIRRHIDEATRLVAENATASPARRQLNASRLATDLPRAWATDILAFVRKNPTLEAWRGEIVALTADRLSVALPDCPSWPDSLQPPFNFYGVWVIATGGWPPGTPGWEPGFLVDGKEADAVRPFLKGAQPGDKVVFSGRFRFPRSRDCVPTDLLCYALIPETMRKS